MPKEEKPEFIYPELSYKINGIFYSVYNELGPGHKEIHYERAITKVFDDENIKYKRQMPYRLMFRGKFIGVYYFDFLVENKIILEIKRGDYFSRRNMHQVNEYLRASGYKLAILANFTSDGVKHRRIVNLIE